MGPLLLALLPTALAIVLSPLAVVAVVAVLVSSRARVNSLTFLAGWVLGIAVAFAGSWAVLHALGVSQRRQPPGWVIALHVVLALVLTAGAVWVLVSGRRRVRQAAAATTPQQVAAAAPQLPGWLQSVEHFTPWRSAAMGMGLFLLNPVDVSCAVAGALTLVLSPVTPGAAAVATALFIVVSSASVAAPVLVLQIRGDRAVRSLQRTRSWIAGNTHLLNALLLLVIAGLQLSKAVQSI